MSGAHRGKPIRRSKSVYRGSERMLAKDWINLDRSDWIVTHLISLLQPFKRKSVHREIRQQLHRQARERTDSLAARLKRSRRAAEAADDIKPAATPGK
jgi:hypothetical protein